MSQQNIDLGSGANQNDGDFVYKFAVAAQANFDFLFGQLGSAGSIKIFERPISLLGTNESDLETKRVADAINAKDPGITAPLGEMFVVSYYKPYYTGQSKSWFYKDSYAVKTGAGFYGQSPPSGQQSIEVDSNDIIKLGRLVREPDTDNDLGEIGSTNIQQAVNSSSSEIVVDGFTVINATRSGTPVQYVFDGEDGSYGLSWDNTAAHNFVDLNEETDLNLDVEEKNSVPVVIGTDIEVNEKNINRTNHITHNTATIDIETGVGAELEVGVSFKLSFSGNGPHTVNYPETDGLSSLVVEKGGLVYCEKRGTDAWTVKELDTRGSNIIYADKYKMNADGSTDDTANIQKLISLAGTSASINTIVFPEKSYKIDSKIEIPNDLKIIGNNTKLITSNIITLFESTAENVSILGITQNSTARSEFFRQKADFNKIEIAYCGQNLPVDEQANYLFIGDEGLNGKELAIYANETNNVTPVFFDNDIEGKKLNVLRVGANISKNCPRYFCRVLGVNTDTPYVGEAYIKENTVTDINGGIADASSVVARFLQIGSIDTTHVIRNKVIGSTTGTNGNFIYMAGGSLNCHGNVVKNLQSESGSAIIHDKKLREDGENWNIFNNTFDFESVITANSPKSIIKILNRDGAFIKNNTFKGLKCYAIDVSQTVLDDPNPQNITIEDNKIIDIDYPIVFNLQQQLKNITIRSNDVFNMTNSNSVNLHGTSDCRLVSMYNTFNQADGQKNVNIYGNTIHECDKSVYMATLYINAAAPTAIKDKIMVVGNTFLDMTTSFNIAFVRFIGTLQDSMTDVKIANNINGKTETIGTEPADLVKLNNMV